MKATRILALCMGLSILVIVSCKKTDVSNRSGSQPGDSEITLSNQSTTLLENGSHLTSSGVTITAPDQVNVGETFNITAAVDCGRIAIERGYIPGPIYAGLTCTSANVVWESLVNFQCASDDASWTGSFDQPGTYIFRTKHSQAANSCGAGNANCTTFTGAQTCCFVIEAVEACETAFTGEAIACGTDREAVFTFKSKDAHDYIKIQGGLTNFTGANATVYINGTVVDFNATSADGWAQGTANGYTVGQRTPGGSINRNIRVEGGLTECEELVIRIVWTSSNAGGVITGTWSVTDANGVELATAVAGLTCD